MVNEGEENQETGKMDALLDQHFINGQLVPPALGKYMDCINPSDETVGQPFDVCVDAITSPLVSPLYV